MSIDRARPWHNPTPLLGFTPEWAGQFDTFADWVNHATQALTGTPGTMGEELSAFCIDTKGRRCHCGADFMRARDEDAFPVRYFFTGTVSTEYNQVLAERQACAAIADDYDQSPGDDETPMGPVMAGQVAIAQSIAAKIRRR